MRLIELGRWVMVVGCGERCGRGGSGKLVVVRSDCKSDLYKVARLVSGLLVG